MNKPVVIIGLGEIGGVFARGFLKSGIPVFPLTREMEITTAVSDFPDPQLVLVAVAENDIHQVLDRIPTAWHDRLVLLQNELLPRDWQAHSLDNPTVTSIWFEKKKGQDAKVLLASPVKGPHADIVKTALENIDIPSTIIETDDDLLYELVRKNVFILTTNIAGLKTGGSVSELWEKHQSFARAVAEDVMDIQAWLVGQAVPKQRLIEGMLDAFAGDPDHKCMGRSAPARLKRALEQADEAGLETATLRGIAAQQLQ